MKRTYLGKILSITIATATILNLVACNEKAESSNSTTKAPETLTEIVAENTTVPTEYITEIVIDEEGNTQINTYPTTQSVANAKGQTQVSTIATQNSDSKVSQNVSKTVAGNSTKTTTAKKSSQSSSSKQQKTTTKTTVKTTTKTTVKYAGKGDERAVAQAVIKWINYYRVQEGKKAAIEMPGKATQYAVGRSKQLVTNFDHDLIDEKIRHCEMVRKASLGNKFYSTLEEQMCLGGAGAIGLRDMPPKLANGEKYFSLGRFQDLETAKKLTSSLLSICVPSSRSKTAIAR